MNTDFEKMADVVIEHDRLCEVCMYQSSDCDGGVRGGPNGPIYPPCCDSDLRSYVDEGLLQSVYGEIVEELK